MNKLKIVIIPGNGGAHVDTDNWYPWVRDELKKRGYELVAQDMPDPMVAHMKGWLPFMEEKLKCDENTMVIGHSSGGVATLRYLETHKLAGAIVLGVSYTDLNYPEEKEAGYYEAPWQWDKIKQNAGWMVQFDSTDDPFIPIAEQRYIHEQLDSEYYEFTDRGHFQQAIFPELIKVITKNTHPGV